MRRLALLLAFTLAACASQPPAETAISEGYAAEWPRIGPQTLAGWVAFPVSADPRPLVLLGETVKAEQGFTDDAAKTAFTEGRVDAAGKVPPEATEAFARLVKPGAGEPKLKVVSVAQGKATFTTDRGPRELPAWIFQLTGAQGPVSVLGVKPDYEKPATIYGGKVSADGLTLTMTLPSAPVPCGGEARISYLTELLESPTAVAVGLKKQTGKVVQGNVGTCRHMPQATYEYPVKLSRPLGNRVLVAANGNPLPAVSAQP